MECISVNSAHAELAAYIAALKRAAQALRVPVKGRSWVEKVLRKGALPPDFFEPPPPLSARHAQRGQPHDGDAGVPASPSGAGRVGAGLSGAGRPDTIMEEEDDDNDQSIPPQNMQGDDNHDDRHSTPLRKQQAGTAHAERAESESPAWPADLAARLAPVEFSFGAAGPVDFSQQLVVNKQKKQQQQIRTVTPLNGNLRSDPCASSRCSNEKTSQ